MNRSPGTLTPRNRRLLRLFMGLTVATFGGPIAIGTILDGGERRGWPPDRTVEWVALAGVSGLVFALLIAILAIGIRVRRESKPTGATPRPDGS